MALLIEVWSIFKNLHETRILDIEFSCRDD